MNLIVLPQSLPETEATSTEAASPESPLDLEALKEIVAKEKVLCGIPVSRMDHSPPIKAKFENDILDELPLFSMAKLALQQWKFPTTCSDSLENGNRKRGVTIVVSGTHHLRKEGKHLRLVQEKFDLYHLVPEDGNGLVANARIVVPDIKGTTLTLGEVCLLVQAELTKLNNLDGQVGNMHLPAVLASPEKCLCCDSCSQCCTCGSRSGNHMTINYYAQRLCCSHSARMTTRLRTHLCNNDVCS